MPALRAAHGHTPTAGADRRHASSERRASRDRQRSRGDRSPASSQAIAVVAPEPRLLPPDEPPGGARGLAARLALGERRRRAARAPARSRAPATRCGPRAGPVASERADLVDEPGVPHPVDPRVDPGVEHVARRGRARSARRVPSSASTDSGSVAENAAAQLDHLERPHDPPAVGRQDRRGGRRVELGEPRVQRRRRPRPRAPPPSARGPRGRCRGTRSRRARR